jgi:antitoxin MazE
MRAKLVRIGNSRGIRLPKGVIDEVGLGDEVELTVKKGEIIITRARQVREGWAEAAKHMAEHEKGMWDDLEDFHDDDLLPDEDWSDLWAKYEERMKKKK